MNMLNSLGRGAYYRLRRISKAFRNWKKFGVVIFGSILLTSSLLPAAQAAGPLSSLYIDPGAISVVSGKTYQFNYKAYDANMQPVTVTPTWSMANAQAGSISSTGLFTAGTTTGTFNNAVKLSAGAMSVYAKVVVLTDDSTGGTGGGGTGTGNGGNNNSDSRLTYLYVDPAAISVEQGLDYKFTGRAYDQNWQPMNVPFTWSINRADSGTINSSTGLFTASQNKGTYENAVKLSSGALSAYARVVVYGDAPQDTTCAVSISTNSSSNSIELGQLSPTYTATVFQNGAQVGNPNVNWEVRKNGDSQNSFTDNGTTFTFTPQSAGTYTITARTLCGTVPASATVTLQVNPVQLSCKEFTIEPKTANLPLVNGSATQVFTLTAQDNVGSDATVTNAVWQVTSGPGTITPVGDGSKSAIFTSTTAGFTSTIRVSGDCNGFAKADTASVSVIDNPGRPLLGVQITPLMPTVLSGTSITYTATPYDQLGVIPDSEPVTYTWSLQGPGSSLGHLVTTTGKTVVFQSNTGLSGSYFDFIKVTAHYKGVDAPDTEGAIFYQVTTQQTLSYVTMTPDRNPIYTNDSTPVRAQAYDNFNVAIPNCSYQWVQTGGPGSITSGTNQQVITFSSQSLVGTGDLRVTATCLNGTAFTTGSVNIVNTNQNVRVEINPDPAYAQPNTDVVFTARCYENNTEVTGSSTVTWTMLNTSAGTIISTNGNQATVRTSGNSGTFGSAIQATCIRNGLTGTDTATIVLNSVTPNFDVTTTMVGNLNNNGTANCSDDVITYVITLTNNQNNNLNNLVVSMNVPANTNFLSASSTTGSPTISGSTITWNAGMLGFGQSKSMTLRVTPRAGLTGNTVINASANVSGNEIASRTINANAVNLNCGAVPTPPRDGKGPLAPTGTPWQTMVAMIGGAFVLASVAYLFLKRREQSAYNAQF